jgi:hypothetical protein
MRTSDKTWGGITYNNVTIHPGVINKIMDGIENKIWVRVWDQCGSLVEDRMWESQDENM